MLEQEEKENARKALQKQLNDLSGNNSIIRKFAEKTNLSVERGRQIFRQYFYKWCEENDLRIPKVAYLR